MASCLYGAAAPLPTALLARARLSAQHCGGGCSMAGVFLSYDRDDTDKARAIALALDKAGHSVWWDLHVRGGAQFAKVIEQALKAADAVVVLWSSNSIESSWVRDEASAGRDSGRLVPVTIDGTEAPLGFRQFQTIDLSKWKGRGKPRQLQALMDDVTAIASGRAGQKKQIDARPTVRPGLRNRPRVLFAVIGCIAAMALIVAFTSRQPWTSRESTTVAIAAADASPTSQAYARDLLAQLGELQAATAETLELVGAGGKRADLVFEVSGATEGEQSRANLVLLDGKTKGLLWSKALEQPLKARADLRQQLGYTAAQVLKCAFEAHPGGRSVLKPDSLKLYLNGCAAYADNSPETIQSLVPLFVRVTREAPDFAGGWAKLLLAESEFTRMTYLPEAADVLAALPAHIAAARKLNPKMPEAFLAEAALLPDMAFERRIGLLQQAVDEDPNNAAVLIMLSGQLRFVGRMNDDVDLARRAVRIDPVSPTARDSMISELTYAGQIDAALVELHKAEQLWPGASNVKSARYAINLRYGDPKEALRMIRSGDVSTSATPYVESFLRARIDPTPANVDRTIADARSWYAQAPTTIYHLVQVLGTFGRNEDVLSILLNWPHPDKVSFVADGLFRPALADVQRDPRMIAVAKRLGMLDYWRKTGKWPDFCFEPDLPYDCKKEAAKLSPTAS
jgi:hypothetical protein